MENLSGIKTDGLRAIAWKDRLKLSPNLASLLGAQALGLIGGLFFAMATARKLSASDFGQFAVWQALLGYLTVCTEFGTAHAGTRRIAASASDEIGLLYKAVLALRILGFFGGSALVSVLFLEKTSTNSDGYWLAGFCALGILLVVNFEWIHLGRHHEPIVARARAARHLVLLAASVVILRVGLDVRTVVVLYVFAAAIQSWLAFNCGPKTSAPLALTTVIDLARECWPLVVALLAQQWVWSGGLISAAKHQASADFDGVAIGYRCYAVGVTLFAAYAAYLLPRSAKYMAQSKEAFRGWIHTSHRHALLVTLLLLVTAPLAGWIFVPLAFGRRYSGAPLASCLYILALIPLLWRITSSNAIVALGKTKPYCAVSLLGACTAILVIRFTPTSLTMGPIFASAAGEIVFAIGSYWTLSQLIAEANSTSHG